MQLQRQAFTVPWQPDIVPGYVGDLNFQATLRPVMNWYKTIMTAITTSRWMNPPAVNELTRLKPQMMTSIPAIE